MKKLLKSILFTTTAASGVLADDFTVVAPISEVVVYRDGGAQITRSGRINLPVGRHRIIIAGLSDDIDEENRPALALDSNASRVTGIKLESIYTATPASDAQRAILDRIADAEKGQSAIQNQLEAKRMQLQFLRSLKGTPDGGDKANLSVDDWDTAISFVGEQATSLLTGIQSLQEDYKKADQTIAALRRELAATGPRRQDEQNAVVSVEGEALSDVAFTFSYFMDDARWELDTSAALNTDVKTLNIAVAAKISQETGENWDNVALTLSTTRPSGFLGNVQQSPIILNLQDPKSILRREMATPDPRMAMADVGLEEIVVVGSKIRTSNTAFDQSYVLAAPASIPATGDEEYVTLTTADAAANLVVRALPSRSQEAYLFADVTIDAFDRLSDVDVTLTRDGHYVGTGNWPDLNSDTLLKLPYGQDNGVNVEVIALPPEDGDTGLFGNKQVEQERKLIKVTNNHTDARTVEIFDRTPVSGHEDIRVRTLRDATSPTEKDMGGKQGLIMWRKTLSAGETWEITHAYSITYPDDKRVVQNR